MLYNYFSNKKLGVGIMARDCNNQLQKHIPKIEFLCSYFGFIKIVVIENDSVDGTKFTLTQWQKRNKNVIVQSLDSVINNNERTGSANSRIMRMCFFRNQYLKYFYDSNIDFDYIIVVDIDIDDFSVNTVLNSIIKAPDNWDALFANGRYYSKILGRYIKDRYYDNYAFVPFDSDEISLTYREIKLNNDYINSHLKKIPYLRCKSAFGGIGIYKYNKIKNLTYQVIQNTRSSYYQTLCEHISINQELKNCYISQELLVLYEKIPIYKHFVNLLKRQTLILFIKEKIFHKIII